MAGNRRLVACVLAGLLLALAGCAAPARHDEAPAADAGLALRILDWTAPGKPAARGGPAAFANEAGANDPSLASTPDGTLLLQYRGCSDGSSYEATLLVEAWLDTEPPACVHQPVLRSRDGGATWQVRNDASGRLTEGSPPSHDTGGLAVDASGRVYTLETLCMAFHADVLEATSSGCTRTSIFTHLSEDAGDTWRAAPLAEEFAQQAAMGAADAGHAVFAWKSGFGASNSRLTVRATFDGGATFTEPVRVQEGLDNMGDPAFSADGRHVYIPYPVQVQADPPLSELRVGASHDGGRTWGEANPGIRLPGTPNSGQCQQGVASAAVLPDGAVVLAFTVLDPATGRFGLRLTRSHDGGATWSPPWEVSSSPNNAVPRLVAGEGVLHLVWAASATPVQPGAEAVWDLQATTLTLEGGLAPPQTIATGIARMTYHISQGAPLTPLNGAPAGNDVTAVVGIAAAALPDGSLAVAYQAHPLERGGMPEIHVARGTPRAA